MADVTIEPQTKTKFDPEAFAMNLARAMENSGQALAAYLKPREDGGGAERTAATLRGGGILGCRTTPAPRSCSRRSPRPISTCGAPWVRRLAGEEAPPAIAPSPRDKRFADPNGSRTSSSISCSTLSADDAVGTRHGSQRRGARPAHPARRRSFTSSRSTRSRQSNFVLTNPEVLRETLMSNGDNLVRGMKSWRRTSRPDAARCASASPNPQSRGGRRYGNHARQGDLPERADATDPVRAFEPNVLRTPLLIVPHDQRILHPRPSSRKSPSSSGAWIRASRCS